MPHAKGDYARIKEHLLGKQAALKIYDSMGKQVYVTEDKTLSGFFTKDVNCNGFAKGTYIVKLSTENEKLVQRFVAVN